MADDSPAVLPRTSCSTAGPGPRRPGRRSLRPVWPTRRSSAGIVAMDHAEAGADRPGQARALPAGHARGCFERDRLPEVVPRPDGLGPHLPGRRPLTRRAAAPGEAGDDWADGAGAGRRGAVPGRLSSRSTRCAPGACPTGAGASRSTGCCFRHEPSLDPARMLAFRMHEFVYVGDPDGAEAHRDRWVEAGHRDALESSGSRSRRWSPTTRSSGGSGRCWPPTSATRR